VLKFHRFYIVDYGMGLTGSRERGIEPGEGIKLSIVASAACKDDGCGINILDQYGIDAHTVLEKEVSEIQVAWQRKGTSGGVEEAVGLHSYLVDHPDDFSAVHQVLVQYVFFLLHKRLRGFGLNDQVIFLKG